MAFQEIERGIFQGKEAMTNTVSVTVPKSAPSVAMVSISADIFKKVGEPMFFNVLIGTGEHSGFIAMIPRNTKGTASYKPLRTSSKSLAKFSISAKKIGLVNKAIGIIPLPFEITSDGIIADIRPARKASISILEAAE